MSYHIRTYTVDSISVFFPAHNEEENIVGQVQDAVDFLESTKRDYEVLVINDGSTDKTKELVQKAFKKNPKVKVFDNDNPIIHCYGSALRKGFASCTKDLIFYSDADRQFDMKELKKFLPKIKNYDYIVGYRIDRQDSFYRIIVGKINLFIVRLLLGINLKDPECAFKLFKKDVIKSIDLTYYSAVINTEMLFKLKKKKYKYTQIGVHHYPRKFGETTTNIKVLTKSFADLLQFRLKTLFPSHTTNNIKEYSNF